MSAQAAYDELIRRVKEASLLDSCAALLGWDEDTYLPRKGIAHRGNQLALLAGLAHAWTTHPRIGELLADIEGSELVSDPDAPAAVNVRELRRQYARLTRLPRSLVEEVARVTALAQQEWTAAFQNTDFPRFRPWLEKVVTLKRREAECIGYETVAYDALLDEYEPGARSADIAALFTALREELLPLVNSLVHAPRKPDVSLLHRDYPRDRQRVFGEIVASGVGFDFERGRLDTTVHPFFTTIGPDDCRIATRYNDCSFNDALFGILHEVGHALYEQGLDPTHHGTPMGETSSLAIHESQSRLWENTVGRSLAFWQHFFPLARQVFRETLHDVSLTDFHFAVNQVEPSVNRVQADEATYNLHILIRFELEQALISGDLPVADLPAAWNEAYRHYLGVVPRHDAEGCLQDGHWGSGLIGYFPTYTLGNVFAAQLFARADAEVGGLERQFAHGDFSGLLGWLRDHVYRHGGRYPAVRLIQNVTGSPPDHRPLVAMLRQRYGELYGL